MEQRQNMRTKSFKYDKKCIIYTCHMSNRPIQSMKICIWICWVTYVMAIGLLITAGLGHSVATFLVPSCQISVPTFTIRFYAIHYCG